MRWLISLLLLSGILLGCGAEYATNEAARYEQSASGSAGAVGDEAPSMPTAVPGDLEGVAEGESPSETESKSPAQRPRIIYTADISLVTKDFVKAAETLRTLIANAEGYISSTTEDRHDGRYRSGQWVARVPVGEFESFLTALDQVGFVESRDLSSQDVTMEYIDVNSRIENLKRLEERFLTLLENKTGKLEDVLQVEQELARVRGEIERTEGRLRYLTNQTDFSTVTINVREERNYVPPKAPTVGSRAATAWRNSLDRLETTGVALLLFLISAIPWVVVLILVGLLLYSVFRGIRKVFRRKRA